MRGLFYARFTLRTAPWLMATLGEDSLAFAIKQRGPAMQTLSFIRIT